MSSWELSSFHTISSISVVEQITHYDVKWEVISFESIPYKVWVLQICFLYAFSLSSYILYCFWCCENNSLTSSIYSFTVSMADNLRRAIHDFNLGIDDEPIILPSMVCNEAVQANQFVLIGRPLIPRHQNNRAIVASLPRVWGLSDVVTGRLVEHRRFQFVFPSDELLQSVLNRGPWALKDLMLVLQRWSPYLNEALLSFIPLWVQIWGIPLQYLTYDVIYYIADHLGHVLELVSTQKHLGRLTLCEFRLTGM